MISKQDILDRATEWQLQPGVVEKDYVLGWLLAATTFHPVTKKYWVFKGGTSIKKCYFETYRFSEDLDFSLLPASPYTQAEILQILNELTQSVNEMSGIMFAADLTKVLIRHDKLNRPTFQGKISYQGPLGQIRSWPTIIFDITNNEPIIRPPVHRGIIHSYPDELPKNNGVLSYSLCELLAEKTRALYERTRPRDLYDIIYLLNNQRESVDLTELYEIFQKKCAAKNLSVPTAESLYKQIQTDEELVADWEQMLAHQLPMLPQLTDFIDRLPRAIDWITPGILEAVPILNSVPAGSGEIIENPTGIHYWGEGIPLEKIRFAGINRLLVEFLYSGQQRLVEPYSLRRASTGNLLLYAREVRTGKMKAFNVAKIINLQFTKTTFTPRFQIEIGAHGKLNIS
ncbi:MAG: nucleotidyl transferase AbiEii/AbiGii toxin family protein [Candidatus Kerfeldbacteria bacterium]|nr:nucleotidyl transferase AbiEii/AbiGii toxin family protein [Candidatus Kerfeldbacteria bacterium]